MVWAEDGVLWCVAECLHEWSEPKPCSAGRPRGRQRSTACGSDQLQVENSLRNEHKSQKRVQGLIKDPDDDDASRDDAATDECPGEGETSRRRIVLLTRAQANAKRRIVLLTRAQANAKREDADATDDAAGTTSKPEEEDEEYAADDE